MATDNVQIYYKVLDDLQHVKPLARGVLLARGWPRAWQKGTLFGGGR